MYDTFDEDYIRELNAAYWAEEAEMEAGVHPSQVKERIEESLFEMGTIYDDITYLDWSDDNRTVKVSLDNKVYGMFDYRENCFV